MNRGFSLALVLIVALFVGAVAVAQPSGRIEGTIQREEGTTLGGVTVILNELDRVKLTDNNGRFSFGGVPAGTYSLNFILGDNSVAEEGVAVRGGETTRVQKTVDWQISFVETITVMSASRRRERIVEAPAAITTLSEEEIQREVSHGQIPKLLEFTPGVEATQSGIYDYNLNTRGFNSSLNRRVVVLVDGRDPSVPFLSSQEWGVVSQYMNDLETAEFVRGPSSALYGKNAFNGVLNLVTKSPRTNQGGELRLTGGELSTTKGDLRWATGLGNDWFFKLTGTYLDTGDFSQDRTRASGVEYAGFCVEANQRNCFTPEVIPRTLDTNEVGFGNLRVDKYLGNGDFFTIEGGMASAQAPAIQTGIGRFSIPDVERTWGRFNYTSNHFNFLGYFNDRQGDDQVSLQSGRPTFLDSQNYHAEVQTNWGFAGDTIQLVAGASHREEEIDSANPQGVQTLMFEPVESDSQAVYSQVDFALTDSLKLVLAARYDESTLHDEQFSPKGSLVWSLNPNNSLRFTYNEAFQVANYSEFFLQGDAAPPLNLSALEAFCTPFGVSCGFAPGPSRIIAVGNSNLDVEDVTSWEVGYTGILAGKVFLTLDYYNSELENFITDLLPNVGTELGRLNPEFGPYQPPAGLPAPAAQALLAALQSGQLAGLFPILSNNFDGTPVYVPVSYTNFGQVDTQGVDLGTNVYLTSDWRLNLSYSWFDFDIQREFAQDPLVGNAPENKGSVGLGYVVDRFDAAVNLRWVDSFAWSVGTLFRGDVESYTTADLTANYRLTESWEIGLNVSDLFDEEHWQSFGGDLIGRRALGHVAYRW
jgi:iron complex outermembrane receptor protein